MKRIPALFISVLVLIPAAVLAQSKNPIEEGCKNWVKMFGLYYQSGESSGSVSQEIVPDGNIDFAIKGRILYINGNKISSPWDLQEVIRSIGRYDRVANLANNIYTYDSKGVLVYEAPGYGKVSEINISFIVDRYDFSAKSGFTGAFSVDNFRYNEKSTIDEVRKNLAAYKIEKGIGDSYRVSMGGIYIYFTYDSATGRLIYVSFGTEK
ncbi:MAG TPA: hypothetical protein PK514_11375 [Spirochaetota bacterium]|nr:hypothetical protein [Spirochaetota bacterium]